MREWWAAFRRSPYFPATVLVLILAVGAGAFAGSYTYAMAAPAPHHIPVAVVGATHETAEGKAFTLGLERVMAASLDLRYMATRAEAMRAIERQQVYAAVLVRGQAIEMDVSSASGASVAMLLTEQAPKVAARAGRPLTIRDVKPLQQADPRGLALFYITVAAVVIGFTGAGQLSRNAPDLNAGERIAFTVAYAVTGAFAIVVIVDWLLGALRLPVLESWFILALTMFTSGMVFTMFNTFLGRWSLVPTWALMVLLGNPSSGGAVAWPLLPSPLSFIGRWLPPGASVNAQHTAVYFPGHQSMTPFLVLGGWALVSCAIFLIWRHRHPGGRPAEPVSE
ncbi:ABC transporter permease [Nonomuraea sp. B12E4]|uniref:ABC transporter permease n=1 Tax=Nonomuraea sp. B12E4 TaxID=3153564 RepID=UPI00325CF438